jgi:alkylhydroperoxidase/carboxymuconolactone decarboxylase family protein YurZ
MADLTAEKCSDSGLATIMMDIDNKSLPTSLEVAISKEGGKDDGITIENKKSLGLSKRKTQFRLEHALQYGLKVMSPPPVSKVQCLFCVHFGREVHEPEKRQREATKNIKYWRPPYRAELYVKHHQRQHMKIYSLYERASHRERVIFFDSDNVSRLRLQHLNSVVKDASSYASSLMNVPKDSYAPAPPSMEINSMWIQNLMKMPLPTDVQAMLSMYLDQASAQTTLLDVKTQYLCTISALIAQGDSTLLEMHFNLALGAGILKADLMQVVLSLAPAVGLPKVLTAMKLAHSVFTAQPHAL